MVLNSIFVVLSSAERILTTRICTFQMPVNDILYGEHEYNTLKALKQAFRDCTCDGFECSDADDTSPECTECEGICTL